MRASGSVELEVKLSEQQSLWKPSVTPQRHPCSSPLTSTRESSALRPSHHLAFSETQLTTFCSTWILSISCTSQLMGCCNTESQRVWAWQDFKVTCVSILQKSQAFTLQMSGFRLWLPFYIIHHPHLLFRGRDVNSDRGGSLLKTWQYDAVTHLPRFYSKHRHHTHRHPFTGQRRMYRVKWYISKA